MRLSELTNHDELRRQRVASDPEYAAEAERHAAADALSAILVTYRVQHGLSATALAREFGWSQRCVARLERGDAKLRLDELEHLARHGIVRVAIDEHGTVIETS